MVKSRQSRLRYCTRHMAQRWVNKWCVCARACVYVVAYTCFIYIMFHSTARHPLQEPAEGCIAESYMFRHVVLSCYVVPRVSFSCWTHSHGNNFSINKQLQEQSPFRPRLSLYVPFHEACYTATRYLQMNIHKSPVEHIGYTQPRVFMWVQTVRDHSCSLYWLLIMCLGQFTQSWKVNLTQHIHKSVYAKRHRGVHLCKLTGQPFMKLLCCALVWNLQSLGQIAPICVCQWMWSWLCDGKKLFKSQKSCVTV